MLEIFEYKGVWYLPDSPEERISGILRFSPDEGAILELIGTLKGEAKAKYSPVEFEIVLGTSTDGKEIILYDCVLIQSSIFADFLHYPTASTLRVSYLLVGTHLNKIDQLRVKALGIEYAHLDEWVNTFGFDVRISEDRKSAVIQYDLPARILAASLETYTAFIEFKSKWPVLSRVQRRAEIKQTVYISITPTQQMSFEELLRVEFRLTTFLGLAIANSVGPTAITCWTENKEVVEIYYQLINTPSDSGMLLPDDMLFTLADTKGQLPLYLESWLRKADLLEPIYSLYFASVSNTRTFLEHRFLSLAQAIESYHRRCKNNSVIPKSEYRAKKNRIINTVDEEDKEWLKQKLAYSNEPSLRERLEEICTENSAVLTKVMNNTKPFIGKVVETRNYYTHFNERLKEKRAGGQQLYILSQRLKMLLELCLLREIGFDDATLIALVERNRRFKIEAQY